jgi:hypothetical protein
MTKEQQLVEEFINDPMSAKYRKELIICLENNDPEGFSRLQDIIAEESLGMDEQAIKQMNEIVNGLR